MFVLGTVHGRSVCVCFCDEELFGVCCLKSSGLALSSGEHNPYMTLSSWWTPSRLFHPNQNNVVHLPLDRPGRMLLRVRRDTAMFTWTQGSWWEFTKIAMLLCFFKIPKLTDFDQWADLWLFISVFGVNVDLILSVKLSHTKEATTRNKLNRKFKRRAGFLWDKKREFYN